LAEPRVWIEQTRELSFQTAGLTALEVRTHNGAINFESQPQPQDEATVTVTKKASGDTQEQAERVMEAIDVFSQREANGTHRLGWKWAVAKHPGWRATVSFEIHAPGNLHFDGETHNGAVTVEGVTGNVRAVTHNGGIEVDSKGEKLHGETHNGAIAVSFVGSDLKLVTHNGGVQADLGACGAVRGTIETHNGQVDLVVGNNTSVDLNCETHNGSIRCDAPLQAGKVSRKRLTGRIGAGGGRLDISTHNGSVRITRPDETGSM
jgi:hypothetical protein